MLTYIPWMGAEGTMGNMGSEVPEVTQWLGRQIADTLVHCLVLGTMADKENSEGIWAQTSIQFRLNLNSMQSTLTSKFLISYLLGTWISSGYHHIQG